MAEAVLAPSGHGVPAADRLYDRNFLIAFISQSFFVTANAALVHYARWITFLGGNELDVGLVMGAGPIVSFVLRPWTGPWIDRAGARATLAIGYLAYMAALVANLSVYDLGVMVYVMRAAVVVSAALVFSSGLAYVTSTCPPARRTEAIGTLGAGGFVGILIGPLAGDFLLGGGERGRSDFSTYFLTASVSVALGAVLLAFLRPTPATSRPTPVRLAEFVRAVRAYWPGTILLVNVVFGLCMTVIFIFLADFLDDRGITALGTFFSAYAGWGLCVRLGLRGLPDRWGRKRVLLIGMGFFAAGMFALIPVSGSRPLFLLVPALLCGTGHGLTFHTMVALTIEPFPLERHGTGSVLALMHLDLGTVGGAPILGAIIHRLGYSACFVLVGLVCLLTAWLYAARSAPSSER